ncbi:MAG: AGE family epimerase/isomerase [Lentisphaeria bacterium]
MSNTPQHLASIYQRELLDEVIPFWQKYSPDSEFGGYMTCLDRFGKVYDTEKYTWLQGRQVWMFAKLYNEVEKRSDWLEMAKLGVDFLTRYGRDADGNYYYALTRAGKPLMQPFSIFSDGFVAMGLSQYAIATGDEHVQLLASQAFNNYLCRQCNPKGPYNKSCSGGSPLMALSLRMIHLNMLLEMAWQLDSKDVKSQVNQLLDEVMTVFLDAEKNVLFENVAPDGSHPDTPAGRLINPGHGLEVLWMVLAVAERHGRKDLIPRAVEAIISTIDYGWDDEFGGILYRRDSLGKPLYQIEWDQKMWWAHAESLVALALAYRLTKREDCWNWLVKLHEYVWSHYRDQEQGEWFGYVNRRGEVLLNLKGGRWKGCFHVPRALLFVSDYLSESE